VPVYRSDITFNASFDLTGVPAYAPAGAVLDWGRAEFLVGASDARGAKADAMITIAGKTETFVPAAALDSLRIDLHGSETQLSLFGAPAAGIAVPNSKFDATAVMKFSGAQRFAILAFGKTTTVAVKGDWPHPGFNGGFLPAKQTITPQGFEADWSVPFIARGVQSEGSADTITRLGRTAMGVSFVELADPYQSVTRSLKYALLFICCCCRLPSTQASTPPLPSLPLRRSLSSQLTLDGCLKAVSMGCARPSFLLSCTVSFICCWGWRTKPCWLAPWPAL